MRHLDFDFSGCQVGVFSPLRTMANKAGHLQNPFLAGILHRFQARQSRVADSLNNSVAITQVNKGNAAVIALTMNPAR